MRSKPLVVSFTVVAAITILTAVWVFPLQSPASEGSGEPGGTVSSGNGPLDGMAFTGELGPESKPKDVRDTFVFANGNFVSKECELRCDYPAKPYFVRETENGIEFVSETRCPYKDAKIVWRGVVDGDVIEGTAVWTINRWYWSIDKTFEFSGRLTSRSSSLVRDD